MVNVILFGELNLESLFICKKLWLENNFEPQFRSILTIPLASFFTCWEMENFYTFMVIIRNLYGIYLSFESKIFPIATKSGYFMNFLNFFFCSQKNTKWNSWNGIMYDFVKFSVREMSSLSSTTPSLARTFL